MTVLQFRNASREHALGAFGAILGVVMVVLGNTIPSLAFMADSGNVIAAVSFITSLYKHETKKAAQDVKQALPGVVESSVSKATADDMMAVVGAIVRTGEQVQAMRQNIDEKHAENAKLFAHLSTADEKNQEQHAEHVAVTDSHGAAIGALGDAVKEMKPEFTLPPLHQRKATT